MKHLLVLHGAIGSKEELEPLVKLLSGHFYIHSLNFPGHGGREVNESFSIKGFAEEVLQWMKDKSLDKINIFGYSMGGYVAVYLARHYPEAVENIITLGTKFLWNKEVAAKEATLLKPDVIEVKVPKFAELLKKRHHPADWKVVVNKTAQMLLELGTSPVLKQKDYEQVKAKVLLLLGDRDKMVSLEETVDVYKQLSAAQLGVLPGTPHMIEQAENELLSIHIIKFLR